MTNRDSRNRRIGYLEALEDILNALNADGEEGAREWISNNTPSDWAPRIEQP